MVAGKALGTDTKIRRQVWDNTGTIVYDVSMYSHILFGIELYVWGFREMLIPASLSCGHLYTVVPALILLRSVAFVFILQYRLHAHYITVATTLSEK